MTNFKVKYYTKKHDLTSKYMMLRFELEKYKNHKHRPFSCTHTYETIYQHKLKIKELEKELTRHNLSVQRLRKVFTTIFKKRELNKDDKLLNCIIENFQADWEAGKLECYRIETVKKISPEFREIRERSKYARAQRAINSNSRIQAARRFIPVIFNFIKTKVRERKPELTEQQLNALTERYMTGEHFEYFLHWYKDEYGNTMSVKDVKVGMPKTASVEQLQELHEARSALSARVMEARARAELNA